MNLAFSCHSVEKGEVELPSLAIFGGSSEGARNVLSSGDSGLVKINQRVIATSTVQSLKGRKKFFA